MLFFIVYNARIIWNSEDQNNEFDTLEKNPYDIIYLSRKIFLSLNEPWNFTDF